MPATTIDCKGRTVANGDCVRILSITPTRISTRMSLICS